MDIPTRNVRNPAFEKEVDNISMKNLLRETHNKQRNYVQCMLI